MRREPQNSSVPVPRFQKGGGLLNHAGGTYAHNSTIDYPRFPISEWHLGKFPDSMEFQSWIVNFRTEVCLRTADRQITMHWIKEVEIAKSIDELMTSRSIVVRSDFTDYHVLDVMIASASNRFPNKHVHFRKKSKCRKAACSKTRLILTRKTNCSHDLRAFPATGAHEAAQGLSGLFGVRCTVISE